MPDMKDIAADVHVGPATSIKVSSKNLQSAAKKAKAKADATANKIPVPEGAVSYRTMGASNFKTRGPKGVIQFNASRYVTSDKGEQEVLDTCVARKLLLVETDNRAKKAES